MIDRQKEIIKMLMHEIEEIAANLKKGGGKKDLFKEALGCIDDMSDEEEVTDRMVHTFSLYTTMLNLSEVFTKVSKIAVGPTPTVEEEKGNVEDLFALFGDIEKNIKMPKLDGPAIDEGEEDGKEDTDKS
jgi:hypothetical protein